MLFYLREHTVGAGIIPEGETKENHKGGGVGQAGQLHGQEQYARQETEQGGAQADYGEKQAVFQQAKGGEGDMGQHDLNIAEGAVEKKQRKQGGRAQHS